MAEHWVVAVTKPQREKWAAENVARQGFIYYLPKIAARKPKAKTEFLFPRYLFVQTGGPWRSLLSTFGISQLVLNGDKPAIVASKEVEAIRAREGADGLVRLPTWPTAKFKEGDAVRINEGLFVGYTGIYAAASSNERVRILLEYLGQKVSVLIGEDHLELA